MEAVPTGQQVVPKAPTRQVLSGTAPGDEGGQFGIGAVQAHVYGEGLVLEKKSFSASPRRRQGSLIRVACCADKGPQCVNRRKLDAFAEKPHLAVDQTPISHGFMNSAKSVTLAPVFPFFFFFLSFFFFGQIPNVCNSLGLAGGFVL